MAWFHVLSSSSKFYQCFHVASTIKPVLFKQVFKTLIDVSLNYNTKCWSWKKKQGIMVH